MSTRSTIARLNADGSVTSVYCHSDGYPEYVGRILLDHYTSPVKVDALLAEGDLSILDVDIGTAHGFNFNERPANQCTFYRRDRGETGVDAVTHPTRSEWFSWRHGCGCEYFYLLTPKGWRIFAQGRLSVIPRKVA